MANRVFISHSIKDRDIADGIGRRLVEADYKVFSDVEVLAGENWASAVSDALNKSDAMVVLLSPEAVESPYVLNEINFALGSAKYEGRVIPVLVRPTEKFPWFLKTIQLIDITKQSDRKAAGDLVVRALRQLERRAG